MNVLVHNDHLTIELHEGWLKITNPADPDQELIVHEDTWVEAIKRYQQINRARLRLAR